MKYLITCCLFLFAISFSASAQRGDRHGKYNNHNRNYHHQGNRHHGPNVNIRIGVGGQGHRHRGQTTRRTSRGNNWGSWTPCCTNDFNRVLNRIDAQCFERDRVCVAKQLIANYHFSTRQIRSILGLFSFESNRLEIAKFAYHYTCDRRNYSYLFDCFSFRSSVRELDNYIHCH